nr:radical SAM protein [Bacteroidota bacterium]
MKLYIIPIQNACNAKCLFCITKHKKETCFGEKLDLGSLNRINGLAIEKIEITGGGEPLLHTDIVKIMEIAAKKAPTQLYTNGLLISRLKSEILRRLSCLCLSRAHHDNSVNKKIMGIEYDSLLIKKVSRQVPVKLSLVLCRSGIRSSGQLLDYIRWGEKELNAKKIVVRQMFDYDYPASVASEFVAVGGLFDELKQKHKLVSFVNENPVLIVDGVSVEFEQQTCACQMNNLVLRPNGVVYRGWEKQIYE